MIEKRRSQTWKWDKYESCPKTKGLLYYPYTMTVGKESNREIIKFPFLFDWQYDTLIPTYLYYWIRLQKTNFRQTLSFVLNTTFLSVVEIWEKKNVALLIVVLIIQDLSSHSIINGKKGRASLQDFDHLRSRKQLSNTNQKRNTITQTYKTLI